MDPDESDSDTKQETMTIRSGLCLQSTLLTPYHAFAVGSEQIQRSGAVFQHVFLPVCPTTIQERPGQSVLERFREPLTLITTAFPESTMPPYRNKLYADEGYLLSGHETEAMTLGHLLAPPPRTITDLTPYAEQPFIDLRQSIEDGSFFDMNRSEVLQVLKGAFHKELDYLKSAYAASCPYAADLESPSPSELLFRRRMPEVDRTLTGILALRWLHNNDYTSFTRNQDSTSRLSRGSFQELRAFFATGLRGYTDHEAVFTLIVMQMTNDLGKSSKLSHELQSRLPSGARVSANHDMVVQQVLQHCDYLIPSFQCLTHNQRSLVRKLIRLSAEFNPGQLVQAECPPAAMNTLTELQINSAELNMKFMEIFLDVAGARGHVDHEGAATMTETTFQGYMQARIQSLEVTNGRLRPEQAYEGVLQHSLNMLTNAGYEHKMDVSKCPKAYAKARLFCMGRVSDAGTASLYEDVYEQLPAYLQQNLEEGLGIRAHAAVIPTYMPAMLSWVRGPKQEEQLVALLTYLSRVLLLSAEELSKLPQDVVIVERDVKSILEPLVKSDDFRKDPASVVNDKTALPVIEIAKRSTARSQPTKS